jgi:hypothetical protein
MINRGRSGQFIIALVLSLGVLTTTAFAQYSVGETISQDTRDKIVSFCANDAGSVTLGDLLIPEQGLGTRVVWLNFFESW